MSSPRQPESYVQHEGRAASAPPPDASRDVQTRIHLAYVLAYRAPQYTRNRSLLAAIEGQPAIKLSIARNRSTGLWRYVQAWRALVDIRKASQPDIYVLGFRGHEIFWPVRWLTRGKPLVVDVLMSPSSALAEEGKAGVIGHLIAPLLRRIERSILCHADLVLTDTELHASHYETRFGLSRDKILVLPVGAIEPTQESTPHLLDCTDSTDSTDSTELATFNVLFFGSMLPLHGIDIIVAAAAKLHDLPVHFDFVGGNPKQARRLKKLCADLGVTGYTHRSWVPLAELIAHDIPHADLCLGGPFGGTPQATRVITGKTSQCLALGKATVVGRIDEDAGFQDKVNCLLVPQANADALADAVRWCFAHRQALAGIGAQGHTLYQRNLSVDTIAARLVPAIERLCATRAGQA